MAQDEDVDKLLGVAPKVERLKAKKPLRPVELTAEEIAALEAEVEEEVAAEAHALALKAKKSELKQAAQQRRRFLSNPEEQIVPFTINLAPNTRHLVIDGMYFVHNATYNVTPQMAQTLNDMVYQTWKHEAQLEGKDTRNVYRQQQMNHLRRN